MTTLQKLQSDYETAIAEDRRVCAYYLELCNAHESGGNIAKNTIDTWAKRQEKTYNARRAALARLEAYKAKGKPVII